MQVMRLIVLFLLAGAYSKSLASGQTIESLAKPKHLEFGHDPLADTIVHLFEWRWDDIADECERFLGPKGFKAVQVSPPQEHIVREGRPWWERYQPVSYNIISRSGDAFQFKDMVDRCENVGVSIYVDVVLNHMAGLNNTPNPGDYKRGIGGSEYGFYHYPWLYLEDDFNRCNRRPPFDDIHNYGDRWEVQYCNLVKLADLKTSSDYVRDQLAGYLNGLIELGVRGFRVDAAKHMPHQDLAAVFSRLTKQVFIYQEVIDLGGEPIQANEYFYLGRVTEFRYGRDLSRTIQSGKLADLVQFGDVWGMMPGGNALVFVDNHDNQRGHGAGGRVLTYKQGEAYALANVFMLAWPYGSAKLMSSYRFEGDNDQGPPMLKDGTTKRVYNTDDTNNCGNDWICEHRWQAIANMVGFRQATGDELRVTNWWSNGNNQIAFGRGNKGFVALNNEKYALNQTLQTSMEPGRYCNVTSGEFDKMNGLCFGEVIEVQNSGTIQLNVNPKASVAIHVGAKLP